MRPFFLLVALVLTAAACATPPNDVTVEEVTAVKQVELNAPFVLQEGESATLGADGTVVRFDGVTDDGRCPENATCVWEGEATAHFTLFDGDREPMPFTLTMPGMVTAIQDMERYQFEQVDAYSAALLLLQPYPERAEEADMPPTATLEMRHTMR